VKSLPKILLAKSLPLVLGMASGWAGAQVASPGVPLGAPNLPVYASLPDLGSGANALISRDEEYQVGRMMLRNLRDENALLDDPETTEYIQSLGSRIGVEAQDGDRRLTFFIVRDLGVNAFAIPGGFIGTNIGLVLLTESESELAGVLAHEIGHVVQRHIARSIHAQGRNSLATIAAVLGAVLIGAISGSPDAAPGLIAMAQGAAMQQQINFTRTEEHEADRVGIGYLAASGFDPNGVASFFGTMMRERGGASNFLPDLLLSHPVDSVRIAEARARVGSMPQVERKPESMTYRLMRERLRVITARADNDLRNYYQKARANDPDNVSLRYGAALAELKAGAPLAAVDLLKQLVVQHPQVPALHASLGQAQMEAGHYSAATTTFERALTIAPRNVALSIRYAEALLTLGRANKAHALLLDLFNNVAPTPEQIRLTALAASAAGDTGDAYFYMSEYHIASGDLLLAATQLDLALAAPRLNEVQRKRFLARRDEIRGYLREQRGDRAARTQAPG
jgi:beta-barrel assembly-enhancing protease